MKRRYEDWSPKPESVELVRHANEIIEAYAEQGFDLTLRQLYYQFVSRDLLANTVRNYKRLGDIVSKARRAGLIDWSAIVDRTRALRSHSSWSTPKDIIESAAESFRLDPWVKQDVYVEVWFEKDALMGVFERGCELQRVPFFSCRGYTSDSEVWSAAQRHLRYLRRGKRVHILHFGDHDPSGVDMTRDIRDRLGLFGAHGVEVERLALNMDQVEEYDPPPNPAKESDSRFAQYSAEYGDESWELDALEPTVLGALVTENVEYYLDMEAWNADLDDEERHRANLKATAARWAEVEALIARGAA